ncbi:FeoA family protein [Garciella nitratireducens]|uniref:Ferrous iron transport protein A n=1 Tax=Garciella nitratireducens DSM 15102 TaxID=1121911 RepID=A0A1T4LXV7_9FIRM|nr:ferrous iron transport protein A [Garciella nitratireducens]RBP44139.1 ferrous iron transport protein A [Garciella nitratireducens]SJZ59495.1 ferrous iron transport protein A [Garciella nitratireducens DSM 15102]
MKKGFKKVKTVNDLLPGQSGEIIDIKMQGPMKKKLYELGLTPGTKVQFVRTAPLGDPIHIKVKEFHLGIRRDMAKEIVIR